MLNRVQCTAGSTKDPYLKTFIQDSKRLPDPQLQAELRDAQAWESFRETNGKWWVEFKEETVRHIVHLEHRLQQPV